ncbi:hypothetical protein NBT05_12575 [Aquimarina sp. ERC-38]|uniref:hypothetical protein n=1 Tax=Aquimarina sp. ERC-38 TaxID=2949996 RepID=UPI002247C05D|nr:hypothetical protein [Aquimarina sp. ERC-38]UZO79783.1 hypothetical protein NBT05_12575 [Aquimarina sp. ERC-38]
MSSASTYNIKLFLFLLSISCTLFSQNEVDEASLYIQHDEVVGVENTNLYKGVYYIQKYVMQEDNHAFFKSYDFFDGSVTYGGQKYYHQQMKYNIVEGQLVISLKTSSGRNILVLNENRISKFTLGPYRFKKLDNTNLPINTTKGIFEVLLENKHFSFYKSYKKTVFRKIENKSAFIKFREKTKFMLEHNGMYYEIKSRKNILNLFKAYKKELKSIKKGNSELSSNQELFTYLLNRVKVLIDEENKSTYTIENK